jgi:Ca2+-binding RTX toxin-like protein
MPRFDLDDLPNHFTATEADDQIFGKGGNDTLFGGSGNGNDDLFGQGGNDQLSGGGGGKDRYYGGSGNDTIYAGLGDFGDLADGGRGRDNLVVNYGSTNLGGLFIQVGSSFFVLLGSAQAISAQNIESVGAVGTSSSDTVYGGIGDDYLYGLDGNDTFRGGAGDDWFDPGQGSFEYLGGSGIDTFRFRAVTVVTTPVVFDVMVDTTLAIGTASGRIEEVEVLDISTGQGSDTIRGGRHDDWILAYDGQNLLDGRAGNDTLQAGRGDDLIWGRDGNDSISAGWGRDMLYGGDGDDTLSSNGPAVEGGAGIRAWGGDGNDTVYASGSDDSLWGDSGDDFIQASNGRDKVFGGDGNDILAHSTGGGRLWGEAGDDMVSVLLRLGRDRADGGTGQDTLAAEVVNFFDVQNRDKAAFATFRDSDYVVRLDGVEMVRGTGFEQVWMIGAEGNDTLTGGAGDDTLQGNKYSSSATDNDALSGEGGADQLSGFDGNDTMRGGGGHDTLTGGRGSDVMTGGTGRDLFRLTQVADSAIGAARDRITDFTRGSDRIDLSPLDPDPGLAGDQALIWRGAAAFSGTAPEARWFLDAGTTVLAVDADGDGAADLEIGLSDGLPLTSGDVIL